MTISTEFSRENREEKRGCCREKRKGKQTGCERKTSYSLTNGEAQVGAGGKPWNTAEHDKAVHSPAPEGGTTNSMESEPPESETCDDEGGDERDKSASADDEMAFIDDAFFELPDVWQRRKTRGGGRGEPESV